jgi:hypothetical protein
MKYLLFTTFLCIGCCSIQGQSLCKIWYSESDNGLCVTFREQGYSSIDELEYIKFKRNGNQIKIKDYFNPRALIGGKNIYLFTIETLTEDTLVLTQNFNEKQFEHMSGDKITFTSITHGCGKLD